MRHYNYGKDDSNNIIKIKVERKRKMLRKICELLKSIKNLKINISTKKWKCEDITHNNFQDLNIFFH